MGLKNQNKSKQQIIDMINSSKKSQQEKDMMLEQTDELFSKK